MEYPDKVLMYQESLPTQIVTGTSLPLVSWPFQIAALIEVTLNSVLVQIFYSTTSRMRLSCATFKTAKHVRRNPWLEAPENVTASLRRRLNIKLSDLQNVGTSLTGPSCEKHSQRQLNQDPR